MKKEALPGVVFLAFLLAFSLLLLLLPARGYSEREKRFLSTSPQIDAQTLRGAGLAQALEETAADQFPLRDLFVGISAYADLLSGKNTAKDVIRGKDGRLFAAPAKNEGRFDANLRAVGDFLSACPVPVTVTAVPESGYIYSDFLPALAPPYGDAAALGALKTSFAGAYADVSSLLEARKDGEALYYKTDHHLTSAGAYLVYTGLCGALGLAPYERDSFTVESYGDFRGTAYSSSGYWLTAPDTIELWRWDGDEAVTVAIPEDDVTHEGFFFTEMLSKEDKYPVFLGGNHALTHLHNDAAPEGTLVLVKDSFAHCPAGFLARHYRDIYLVDLRYYKEAVSALIEQTAADRVLILYGVSNLLSDSSLVWLR